MLEARNAYAMHVKLFLSTHPFPVVDSNNARGKATLVLFKRRQPKARKHT